MRNGVTSLLSCACHKEQLKRPLGNIRSKAGFAPHSDRSQQCVFLADSAREGVRSSSYVFCRWQEDSETGGELSLRGRGVWVPEVTGQPGQ